MRILTLAVTDLRLTLRDRSSLFWIFLAPLLWVYLFGFISRPSDPSKTQIGLLVVDEDASPAAQRLIDLLRGENFRVTVAGPGRSAPQGNDAPPRSLTIPSGLGAAVAARRKTTLDLRETREATPEGTFAAQVALHKATVRLLAGEALGGFDPGDDLVRLRSSWGGASRIPTGYYQTIPGNLVMFVLLSTMTYGAGLLAAERKHGLLRRLASSPLTRSEIITGKLAGRAAVALVQVAVFIVIGLFIFRIDWGHSPAGLLAVVACFVLCAASIGLLGGALFASGEAASGMGVVLTLTMSALGGCWWPAEVMPGWLRVVAYAFPTSWAMKGLHQILSWGGGLRDVLLPCGLLLLFGVAAGALAVNRLRITAA